MFPLKTVQDRMEECAANAAKNGQVVERFYLGEREMEDLKEWCDPETYAKCFASGMPAVAFIRGHRVVAINLKSHFSVVLSHVEQLV